MPREKSTLHVSPSNHIHFRWIRVGVVGWAGDLGGNKVEKKNTFLQRTYNVLESTSTNITSTSVWSLRNSWMQYITLTLPCLDPGRQGPEREEHTGWGSGRVQGSRSPNLTVVCKKESRCEDCILSAFQIVRTSWDENLRNPRRHFKWSDMIISYFKNKDHFF